jgi:hypothetical protein
MPKLLKQTFKAWLDEMPGSPSKLIVTGDLEVPTPGWKAELKLKVPQGINPKILLLEVHAQAPQGNVNQIVQKISLRYEQAASPGSYTEVTIFYESDSVTVPVKPVH